MAVWAGSRRRPRGQLHSPAAVRLLACSPWIACWPGTAKAFWSSVHHLLLRGRWRWAAVARLPILASMMRSSMLEVLPQGYMLAARAEGLPQGER